jgi:cytochrome c peroxidase
MYAPLDASNAGCVNAAYDQLPGSCPKPGQDDPAVVRVVANFGKAIAAYTRKLTCGRSRFDAWMEGDEKALNPAEQAGAVLFVSKGCVTCHTGPYLTDDRFHNLGVPGSLIPFTGVMTINDPGAKDGIEALLKDPVNSEGPYSDGHDNRLDELSGNLNALVGAFKTPSLRCVTRRASFMHNAEFRNLLDAIDFFNKGPADSGYVGVAANYARNISNSERDQLIAFLNTLNGDGPDPALTVPLDPQ